MKLGILLPLILVVAGSACSHPEPSPVPRPPESPAPIVECALDVQRVGSAFGLAFVLSNHTTEPRTIRYYRPFLQFDLHASASGRELVIVRGDFDGPAAPAELFVPAGGTARLETPVTLRFSATALPGGDGFSWTVVGEPRTVELRATLRIEHESFPECVAHLDRT